MRSERGGISVRVWGRDACFTRPEMKVERVSYDVMTPSAARGILEAIFWKPEIRWEIQAIDVLRPIRWASVRRNEVSEVSSHRTAAQAMRTGRGNLGFCVDEHRQQRAALILQEVAYRIHARFRLTERAGPGDDPGKYLAMAERRITRGQCFHRPYLGCREFAASFGPVDPDEPALDETRDLGWMLYDIDFGRSPPTPQFFRARLDRGRIAVPTPDAEEVRG